MADDRLRIFTLNCWGLKFVSKHRKERVAAIARFLAESDYDIVALQELWVFTDYEHVRGAVSKNLPHSKFFYSGALGAGLVIFSRFPIIAATVHPYSLNGSPIDVIAGDWFVGKAAASILIAHPILGHTQIFNTHLFAKGGDEGPDHFKAHRLVGAWEFAKLARQAAEVGRHVIAVGDFNSVPVAPPIDIIRDYAGLSDAWDDTHRHVRRISNVGVPSPVDAIHMYGVTADSPLNSYSAGKQLETNAKKYQGKRLDYVLYRAPFRPSGSEKVPNLRCVDTKVLLTENVPGRSFSYSDHFGLEATFKITLPGRDATDADETYISAGSEATSVVVNPALNLTASAAKHSLSPELISSTIGSLTARYRFATAQAKLHLTVFVVCIGLLFAIVIGTAWLPRSWINPIFTLLTIFLSWLATTMLYIGFIYGKWEVNALTNIIEELEIYRATLDERGTTYTSWRSAAR